MHLERGSRLALVAMFPVLVLASCEAEDDGEEVSRGGWGQPCYSDQTCDYGLACFFVGDRFACDWQDAPPCTPNCAGKDCGDDGCGGTCGTCSGYNEYCDEGRCISDPVRGCKDRDVFADLCRKNAGGYACSAWGSFWEDICGMDDTKFDYGACVENESSMTASECEEVVCWVHYGATKADCY